MSARFDRVKMIVIDASVLVHALGDDGDLGATALRAIERETLCAPAHYDIETVSGWRRHVRIGSMTGSRARTAVEDLKQLSVRRVPHAPMIDRIWELRDNLSTQDAAYVAIAEEFGIPLLTADLRLAGAPGTNCEFRLLDE